MACTISWPERVSRESRRSPTRGDDPVFPPVTLPLPLRNRLAELIIDSLHDPEARKGLEAVVAACADPGAVDDARTWPEAFPRDLFERRAGAVRLKAGFQQHASELGERSGRAWRLLAGRPLDPPQASLDAALGAAAALFDARLYFEVHELLEPHWMRAEGSAREALQGLIQVAVGFQHLANGNLSGARALLRDGCAKIRARGIEGLDLDPFARAVERCLDAIVSSGARAPGRFPWTSVPRFPVRL